MAWSGLSLVKSNPVPEPVFDRDSEGQQQLSGSTTFGTQVFSMDAQTGAYTFGYDTGIQLYQTKTMLEIRNYKRTVNI